jgi:hypothetical protein
LVEEEPKKKAAAKNWLARCSLAGVRECILSMSVPYVDEFVATALLVSNKGALPPAQVLKIASLSYVECREFCVKDPNEDPQKSLKNRQFYVLTSEKSAHWNST